MLASIIGLGLVGGSAGAALRRSGVTVRGFDTSPGAMRVALARELVDEIAGGIDAAVDETDVVVLAAPVSAIVELLPVVDAATPLTALIMDTGSVKTPIVRAMEGLPGSWRAIGGHPLAGTEMSGPAAADPLLFRGRPFALVPSRATSEETVERAMVLVRALDAEPVRIDAEEHDRVLGRTSHLPQLISTALALSLETEDARLSGPALQSMTRLAASPPGLWQDILLANQSNVSAALRRFLGRLEELTDMVESGDLPGLERAMRRANELSSDVRSGEPA